MSRSLAAAAVAAILASATAAPLQGQGRQTTRPSATGNSEPQTGASAGSMTPDAGSQGQIAPVGPGTTAMVTTGDSGPKSTQAPPSPELCAGYAGEVQEWCLWVVLGETPRTAELPSGEGGKQ